MQPNDVGKTHDGERAEGKGYVQVRMRVQALHTHPTYGKWVDNVQSFLNHKKYVRAFYLYIGR